MPCRTAFISAFRRADAFRGEAAVTTWLHRIVVNACLDRLRREKVSVRRAGDLGELDLPDLHDRHASTEVRLDVREALARLPEGQRMALVLVDMHGLPVAEAAQVLGVAEGTVKSRCFRGREALAAMLRERDDGGSDADERAGRRRRWRCRTGTGSRRHGTAGGAMTSHRWPGPCVRRPATPPAPPEGTSRRTVSQQHDDTAPVEHDPTGMRALLASLPDPGPMPDDLVARISAALADEAQRGDGIDRLWGLDEGDGGDSGSQVAPIRRRRFEPRHLAVAAAVVGILGLGGFLVRSVPGDVMASLGIAGGSGDSGAAADTAAGARAQALVAPEAGSGEVVVVMSGVDHSSDRLDVSARELDDGTLDPVTRPQRRVARDRPDRDTDRRPGVCHGARHPCRRRILVDVARSTGSRRRSSSCTRTRAGRPRPSTAPAPRATPSSSAARYPSADALQRRGPPTAGRAAGNTTAVGSVPRRHRMLRSPPLTTTRGCVP